MDMERIIDVLARRIVAEYWVQVGLGVDSAEDTADSDAHGDDALDGARRIIADLEVAGFEIVRN